MELGFAVSTSICRTVFDEASILDGPCIFVSQGLNSGPESAPESKLPEGSCARRRCSEF